MLYEIIAEHYKNVPLNFAQLKELCLYHRKYYIVEMLDSKNESDYDLFLSDGCSMWPDEWGDFINCFWHDIPYYLGCTPKQRLMVDRILKMDVTMTRGSDMAQAMYKAVRIGGGIPGTGFHNGYGLLK